MEDCGWPAGDAKRVKVYTDKVGDEGSWKGENSSGGGWEDRTDRDGMNDNENAGRRYSVRRETR